MFSPWRIGTFAALGCTGCGKTGGVTSIGRAGIFSRLSSVFGAFAGSPIWIGSIDFAGERNAATKASDNTNALADRRHQYITTKTRTVA